MKSILALIALTAAPAFAKAPTWAQDCAAAGQKAMATCEAVTQDAGAADIGQAVGQSAQLGSGAVINRGAQAGVNQASGQVGRLKTALVTCQKAETECAAKCEEEEQDRSSRQAGPPQDPMTLKAKAQAGQVVAAKQSSCVAPLKALETKLAAGLNDVTKAGGESTATRDATPGQMPQMPQNQAKGGSGGESEKSAEPKSNDTKTANSDKIPNVTPKITDCKTDPNAATLDQCKKSLVDSCSRVYSAGGSDTKCEAFTAQFCNATPPPPAEGGNMAPTSSRPGEGIGSHFCNLAVSHDFCATPSRKDCMTCQNYRNFTAADCQLNSANCTAQISQELAAQNCKDAEPPLSASLFSGLTLPVAGQSGGGAAAGGSSSGHSEGRDPAAFDPFKSDTGDIELENVQIRADTSEHAPGVTLFGIGTKAIENMCNQQRLNHCKPR